MALKPLQENFLFEFANETRDGKFVEKSKFGFILTNLNLDQQTKYARWGKVLAIGPEVTDFKIDDLVLIESGMWTTSMKWEKTRYWRSEQSKVIATSNDDSVVFTC